MAGSTGARGRPRTGRVIGAARAATSGWAFVVGFLGIPAASVADEPRAPHAFTLAECLSMADRNFANLWAARARLAQAHAQLDEAVWTPWFQGWITAALALGPEAQGTVLYPQSTLTKLNIKGLDGLWPYAAFGFGTTIPLYTFGKIEAARDSAEANVRVSEWDMEKQRQQMHMDVRRAYFGVELARDAAYVVGEAIEHLDKAIESVKSKLSRGAANVGEGDRLRLEAYRQEIKSLSLQAPKGETVGLAALRFITGQESHFELLDEPLKRPDRPLVAIVQYIEAARILRPDVNVARAMVTARKDAVDYSRAKLFPDIGLSLSSSYTTSPGAPIKQNVWANDSFNQFLYAASFSTQWGLDLLPRAARMAQAEAQFDEARSLQRMALGNAIYEVEKAYADAAEAKGREEAWDRAEHESKQWLVTVEDQVDLGTAEESALLEPLRVYGSARVKHLYALMDLDVAMSGLAAASGWDAAAPSGN